MPATGGGPPPVCGGTVAASATNCAIEVASACTPVSVHVLPDPAHAPDQPLNAWPLVGVAVSVTLSPASTVQEPPEQTALEDTLEADTLPKSAGLAEPDTVCRAGAPVRENAATAPSPPT